MKESKMNKLKVGQVVYVLDLNTQTINPAQILVENIQRTIKGKSVNYDAMCVNSTTIKIDDSNAHLVFESSKKVFDYLISQATSGIGRLVEEARQLAEKTFTQQNIENPQEDQLEREEVVEEQKQKCVKISLPDGTIVESDVHVDELL